MSDDDFLSPMTDREVAIEEDNQHDEAVLLGEADAPTKAAEAGPLVIRDELAHFTEEQRRFLEEKEPRQVAYLAGRRGYSGAKLMAALASAGYPAAVADPSPPPPAPPVVQEPHEAEQQEDDDERNARIRRGRHAVEKGHRIEIHGGRRGGKAVVLRQQSRRAPERNKYADVPRGTTAKDRREKLARKNGAE